VLFPYGTGMLPFPFPQPEVDVLTYRSPAPEEKEQHSIEQALDGPIATRPLTELATGCSSAVILISDITRLSPSYVMLPLLLDRLNAAGIPDAQIRVIVSLGAHRKQTEQELRFLTGSAYERVVVENHSALPEDNVYVGTTTLGTRIALNRAVVEAELRIATGNIEPHRLVGMSGGVKALFPGVACAKSIEQHHALSHKYKALPGYTENPLHQDLEEIARLFPIHFLCNVVVNHQREILGAFAGDPLLAHRVGAAFAQQCFLLPLERQYDVVVASAGGAPKDMQLYQAIKSLENAAGFTKPGGTVLLLARCEELYGNGTFQQWVETHVDRSIAVEKLTNNFVLGAHKLLLLDRVLQKHRVFLYSELPDTIAALLGIEPVSDLQQWANEFLSPDVSVVAMPCASLTFARETDVIP
jgi:nickel-dependent lactate racemase